MVRKGEYLERSVFVTSGGLALDALFHRGTVTPPCVLAAPHPALGGSMVTPVVAELVWALTRAGHATLRFDYRGVGASQGTSSRANRDLEAEALPSLGREDLGDEVADLLAAADQLRETANVPSVCVVGYSFGAAVAAAAATDPRIERLVLVAPPTAMFEFSILEQLTKPLAVICGHEDRLTDRAALQRWLPPGTWLEIIPYADHGFRRGLTELGKTVAAWLRGGRPEYVAPPDGESGPVEVRDVELPPGDPLELDLDPKR